MSIVLAIVLAVVLFSLIIFVHELGHFVAAKLSKVQVNEFAIFMGPPIVQWQRGQTKYSIRCIPIGGYCAMEGEDEDTDNPRSFQKAAWWKRFIILIAGSAMNLLIGLLIMVIVYLPVKQVIQPVIESFTDFSTVNSQDGLQVGDRILELDGERIYMQSDFAMLLNLNPGDVHDLVVDRQGKKVFLDDFTMEKHLTKDQAGNDVMLYGINFTLDQDLSFADKVQCAWNESINTLRYVRLSLKMIFTGKAGLQDMTGPVGIVAIMSETAQNSETSLDAVMNLLYFGAFLALNLGVMNLLPLPALDGGRIVGLLLTTGIEAVTRKKLNPKFEGYVHGIGMFLLLGLMAIILFKDLFTIFKG